MDSCARLIGPRARATCAGGVGEGEKVPCLYREGRREGEDPGDNRGGGSAESRAARHRQAYRCIACCWKPRGRVASAP